LRPLNPFRTAGADVSAVEGDLISRCELFDATDLHTALARFDELEG